MNVLSLFDGMSCGRIALQELCLPVTRYYASEIDKFAIQQSTLNFPDTIHLGSVTGVDVSKLEPIDLLIGGSPCQSFSFAGKCKGMATKCDIEILDLDTYLALKSAGFEFEGQSYLFWEYVRVLRDIQKYNPGVKFLLENVKMGKKWEAVLTGAIGCEGIHINSALVCAQNRRRIYWTNIEGIQQPADRGILLRDILEDEVDEKYYLKMDGSGITALKLDKQLNPKRDPFNAGCLTAGAHSGGNHSDMDLICVSMVGRRVDENGTRRDYDPTLKAEQRLEACGVPGKTNCLTTVGKDNLIFQNIQQAQEYVGHRTEDVLHTPDDKFKTLCAENGGKVKGRGLYATPRIRRLTPKECCRLQTVPDWYKWAVSDTQQYKMLGNGWTVEVIKHILSYWWEGHTL